MSSLAHKLSEILGKAFVAESLPAELGIVRVSDRPDLAQFQCNGAMAAAKIAKENPRVVAEKIVERLRDDMEFSKVEIAGPGFINLTVMDDVLTSHLRDSAEDKHHALDFIKGKHTVVLDYGGPNLAKPMHVGHLRASIIGDSLRRICLAAGYKAIGDVHLGDWGLPMGQVISELELRHPDWVYFDPDFKGDYPMESPVTMEDLEEIYPAASAACKGDEARLELARQATADLQNKRRGYWHLWEHFVDVSIKGMKENFDRLGVHFDLWNGEASVHDYIAPMIKSLEKKGLAEDSDGALIVSVAKEDDNKEVPPLILLKSDGAVMYGTTDLATIVERVKTHHPEKILYVVDQRQSLHFEQVFRAARLGDIAPEKIELTHAGFGTMNGTDGKPFKTRAGGVMKLADLIDSATEKAQNRLNEAKLAADMDQTERDDIAHKVAIAAIKFADLQNNRIADYVFDLDRMMAFEGKTGPYLLYQAVRIKSLLKKADVSGTPRVRVLDDNDRPLALLLCELPDHFALALKNYTPHVLCEYVYKLAQEFSKFYAACHIMSEEDARVRESRLALCMMTADQIEFVLGLLGINVPERM